MATDEAIEKEIQDKGLNAPRLTPDLIESVISSEHYSTGDDLWGNEELAPRAEDNSSALAVDSLGCLTVCVLVLKSGYTVVGKSACASLANFDAELGRKIAREDARRQIWALEGYLLRSALSTRAEPQE